MVTAATVRLLTSMAARTPVEEPDAAIWRGLLGVDRVGVDDNFFAVGASGPTVIP